MKNNSPQQIEKVGSEKKNWTQMCPECKNWTATYYDTRICPCYGCNFDGRNKKHKHSWALQKDLKTKTCWCGCSAKLDENTPLTPTPSSKGEKKIDDMIKHTFSHLVRNKKDPGYYCVHDVEDNCFEDIKDFRQAVKNIIKSL